MLDMISEGFEKAKSALSGHTTLNEENISSALESVRESLLEADVEYGVVKTFTTRVKESVLGQTVKTKAGKGQDKIRVSPAQHFIKSCQEELEALMGPVDPGLHLPNDRPALIMMVGLQGSGKTTSTGKLCRYLMAKKSRKPLLVAADVYRPAAIDQLQVLGQKIGATVYTEDSKKPVEICKNAVQYAKENGFDAVLLDTAGRLTVDADLMAELQSIKKETIPDNILFVCDAMMGQDAVTTAASFDNLLDISGVIMTKLDGDTRGGAALSIKEVTGKPLKFLGIGEGLDALEEFRPEGLASRILGMGDVVGLMQDFEKVAEGDEEEQAMKMLKGEFTFTDFYKQISMIQKMGSLKDLAAKLPMQGLIPKGADINDNELIKVKAMIDSMTKMERIKPTLLNPSRVQRIAGGSGRSIKDVNELIQKFSQMRKMMSMMGKGSGLLSKIPGMGGMSQMKEMAQAMGGMGGLGGLMGGGGGSKSATRPKFDRDKQKKQRKQARKAKRKNRKGR